MCGHFVGRKAIGFLTWFGDGKAIKIQLAEIEPGFRKKDYGRILMNAVADKLKQDGCMGIHLQSHPQNSEKAWRKIGFQRYPALPDFDSCNNEEEGLHLYHILIPHAEPIISPQTNEVINLWSVERYQADRFPSTWSWGLDFQPGNRKLVKPIVIPVSHKWNINWTRDGKILKSDGIKYFSKDRLDHNEFLIIEELH